MSLVLNMIGGGGSFSPTDAILRVQAPSNSTVTISKGGTTKTDYGHENANRPTIYDYYFIIHKSQFDGVNPWTVTATRGSDSNSTTIIINASDEFDLSLSYHVPIQIYQEVEYIQSTGTQYIDLSLNTVQSGYSVDIDTETVAYASNNPVIHFGTGSGGSRTVGNISATNDGGNVYAGWFNNNYQGFFDMAGTSGKVNINCEFESNSLAITLTDQNNNSSVLTWSFSIPTFGAVRLFNNTSNQYGKFKLFYMGVYNGNTTVRELYPCYRLSDSVAGLYDKANGVFYTNGGSGTFIVGADV